MESFGIAARDLGDVVFFEKPFAKFERLLRTSLQEFPRSYPLFREMITWLGDKLWIKQAAILTVGRLSSTRPSICEASPS